MKESYRVSKRRRRTCRKNKNRKEVKVEGREDEKRSRWEKEGLEGEEEEEAEEEVKKETVNGEERLEEKQVKRRKKRCSLKMHLCGRLFSF